jgi:Arginyl-tRNA synthetase
LHACRSTLEDPLYLQYAHARIASIVRFAESEGIRADEILVNGKVTANLSLLKEKEEINLAKLFADFPDVVESAAFTFEPHRIINYLQSVAEAFHHFYHVHRVVIPQKDLSMARLSLCLAAKTILSNGFKILGISAPERM